MLELSNVVQLHALVKKNSRYLLRERTATF